jgi:hypothetical protein
MAFRLEGESTMSIRDDIRPHEKNRGIDQPTFWLATVSATVVGSWIFTLFLIAHNTAVP